LKKRATTTEKLILLELVLLGFLFQEVVLGYIPDFLHRTKKLIIELDGGYHFATQEQIDYDRKRNNVFRKGGYKILRFTNERIENELPAVLEEVKSALSK
jgi:very-short-patch-repair endonuclease